LKTAKKKVVFSNQLLLNCVAMEFEMPFLALKVHFPDDYILKSIHILDYNIIKQF